MEGRVIHLKLNIEEKEILIGVLESYVSDLRYEIADTDSFDFRTGLKKKEAVLTKLLNILRQSVDNVNPQTKR